MYSEFQLEETYRGFQIRSHGNIFGRIVCVTCAEGDERTFSNLLEVTESELMRLQELGKIRVQYASIGHCVFDREIVAAAAGNGFVFQRYAIEMFKKSIDGLWTKNIKS